MPSAPHSHSTVSRRAAVLALAVLLPLAQGCSFLVEKTQTVTIRPSDPNAEVFVNDEPRGRGNLTLQLDRKTNYYVVVAKLAGREGRETIASKISPMGILDIVGGLFFLVPFVGLMAPGAYQLELVIYNAEPPYPSEGVSGLPSADGVSAVLGVVTVEP